MTRPASPALGRVTVDGVVFRAPAPGGPQRGTGELHLLPGRTTAVLGRAALPLRRGDGAAGRIDVDGVDVRESAGAVGVVSGHAPPLVGTLGDQLPGAPAAVERALRAADAHRFVAALGGGDVRRGLAVAVGPGERVLSREQRLRLAVARVVLDDPALVVLDDPTAGVPGAAVLRALRRVAAGRTCLVLGADERLLGTADAVLVPHRGALRERHRPVPGAAARWARLVAAAARPGAAGLSAARPAAAGLSAARPAAAGLSAAGPAAARPAVPALPVPALPVPALPVPALPRAAAPAAAG